MALSNSRSAITAMTMATALTTLVSAAAFADATSTTASTSIPGTSSASVRPNVASKILKNLSMKLAGTYYGGSLDDVGSSQYAADNGSRRKGDTGSQHFENTLINSYKLNDNGVSAALGINFNYTPVRGEGFELVAPYLKVADTKLISIGNFNYSADFRTYLPVTNSYHNKGRTTRLRSIQAASYDVPTTRLSVGYLASINYFILNSKAADSETAFDMSFVPGAAYQLSPKLALNLDYEMETGNTKGSPSWDLNGSGTWLYPGATWTPNEKINIHPYLTMNPGTKFLSTDTMKLTCDFTASLL